MENKQKKFTITEQDIEENQNFSVNSEQIASFIIEKIISLAITEEQRKKTNNQIPNKCFSYLTEMIKSYLKLEFIAFDVDDYLIEKGESVFTNENIPNAYNTKSNWLPVSNIKNNNKNYNNNKINKRSSQGRIKNEDINESSDSHSTICKDNSKQFQSIPSIDSVKLENSFNKHIENDNEIINFDKPRNVFFDNYIFGMNDWTINQEPVYLN